MHEVQNFRLGGAAGSGGSFRVRSLGLSCPLCRTSHWIDFNDQPLSRSDMHGQPRTQQCPSCGGTFWLYVVALPERREGWLYVHPSPTHDHVYRDDVAAALTEVHEALGQAYESAVAVLTAGQASPAATEARRTLEGLVKHLLKDHGVTVDERTPLGHLLKQLPDHVDLARPITETANAVRDGGNLGAHYDTQVKATPEMAREALGLVEAIVDYLLILPTRVERLRQHIEAPTPRSDDNTDD